MRKYIYKYFFIFFALLSMSCAVFANECQVGAKIVIGQKLIKTGQPIKAIITLWNNKCLNIHAIKNNSFLGNNLYLYKIYSKKESKNNSEVTVLNAEIIFTKQSADNITLFTLGRTRFFSKKYKFKIVKNKKTNKLYFFKLDSINNTKIKQGVIVIFIVLIILTLIKKKFFTRQKKAEENRKGDYKVILKDANNLQDYVKLYEFRNDINQVSITASELFYMLNKIQYKKEVSKEDVDNLNFLKKKVLEEAGV